MHFGIHLNIQYLIMESFLSIQQDVLYYISWQLQRRWSGKKENLLLYFGVCVCVCSCFFSGLLENGLVHKQSKWKRQRENTFCLLQKHIYTQEAQYAYTLSECECECDHRASGCSGSVGLVRVNGFSE